MTTRLCIAILAGVMMSGNSHAQDGAVTPYGVRNAAAPEELALFAFLVGKWEGGGRTKLPDGSVAEFDGVTWIGRYVLDGMAIADEGHTTAPDGSPYIGISLRYFEPHAQAWVIDYLNVSRSFVRAQVNPRGGSVERIGDRVVVTAEDGDSISREHYSPAGDSFTYSIDISNDGGQTWTVGSIEMSFTRVE